MTPAEASALIGTLVRLRAQSGRSTGFIIARLRAVTQTEALVVPQGHKHELWVPLSRVKPWAKGQALTPRKR